jgi:Zn finger protein HypA/HybF involved in hydrogenase expression
MESSMNRKTVECPHCELTFLSSRLKTICPGCKATVEPREVGAA